MGINNKSWKKGFHHLTEYKKYWGNTDVPRSFVTWDGFKLGLWVYRQRVFKSNMMKNFPDRYQQLNSLGFNWTPNRCNPNILDKYDKEWNDGYSHLLLYKSQHNNMEVPVNYVCTDGFKLGIWVHAQRLRYIDGTLARRFPKRIQLLESVGFNWKGDRSKKPKLEVESRQRVKKIQISIRDMAWSNGYLHLLAYKGKNKRVYVPQLYISPDGFKLGVWARTQQQAFFSGKMEETHPERIILLDNIGFVWRKESGQKATHKPYNACWEKGYNYLSDYKAKHDSVVVPPNYKAADGYTLGAWVKRQKNAYKNAMLTYSQIIKLDKIGFIWGKASFDRNE